MRPSYWLHSLLVVLVLCLYPGCALLDGLRSDFDDGGEDTRQASAGGAWPEGEFLDEEVPSSEENASSYGPVGHTDRSLASTTRTPDEELAANSRLSDQDEMIRRDALRRMPGEAERMANSEVSGQSMEQSAGGPVAKEKKLRWTREDFVDRLNNEGSLWASDGQTNYYFTKNKVRSIGEIVSLKVEDPLLKDIRTEVIHSLAPMEQNAELRDAQAKLLASAIAAQGGTGDPTKTGTDSAAAKTDKKPAAAKDGAAVANADEPEKPNVRPATLLDIDVSNTMDLKSGDTILGEIIDRFPNGNYKVRAAKRVPYRNSFKLVSLVGVVKAADISEDDTIQSGKLYEYRVDAE